MEKNEFLNDLTILDSPEVIALMQYFENRKSDEISKKMQLLSEVMINLNKLDQQVKLLQSKHEIPYDQQMSKIDKEHLKTITSMTEV